LKIIIIQKALCRKYNDTNNRGQGNDQQLMENPYNQFINK